MALSVGTNGIGGGMTVAFKNFQIPSGAVQNWKTYKLSDFISSDQVPDTLISLGYPTAITIQYSSNGSRTSEGFNLHGMIYGYTDKDNLMKNITFDLGFTGDLWINYGPITLTMIYLKEV